MKKFLSIVMAIVLVATSAIALSATVFAESGATLTLDSKSVEVGNDVEINLTLSGNPGVQAIIVTPVYDKGVFTLKKVVKGTLFDVDNAVNQVFSASEEVEDNGVICTYVFTVNSAATAGDYDVTLVVREAYDGELNSVNFTVKKSTVTVTRPYVAVSKVTLDKTSADMYVGDTLTLNATVTPADATNSTVSWKSSDEKVATVNNGVVTALKEGTVTITATAEGKSATCKVTTSVKPCDHSKKTFHDAKASTCKAKGWDAYYTCDDCNVVLDGDGKVLSGVPFRALAEHTEGTAATCTAKATCSVCGAPYGELLDHDFSSKVSGEKYLVKKATCVSNALYYKSCAMCGAAGTETFEDTVAGFDSANHTGDTVLKGDVAPTEETEGYSGDVHCKDCDALIEAGRTLDKLPHEADKLVEGVKSTCVTQGKKAYYTCKNCDGKFLDKECTDKVENDADLVLNFDSSNHTGETVLKGYLAATEEAEGYSGDLHCKDCDALLVKGDVLPKLPHTPVLVEAVEATCDKEGMGAYYHCDNCDKNFSDAEGEEEIADINELVTPINPDVHSGETEVKGAVAATVEKEGYSGDTYCKDCGAKLAEGTVLPKLPAPTEKVDDTKKDDTTAAGSPDSVPSTGDEFSVTVFAVLALLSTGVLGVAITSDRKKRRA